ncbi:MAG: hypothetical protein AABZ63_04525 [Actinomycetota bacterium]
MIDPRTFLPLIPRQAFLVAGATAVAVFLALAVDWTGLSGGARRRGERRRAVEPLVQEAGRLGLDWTGVVRDPGACLDKPVLWKLTHPQPGEFYFNGEAGKAIVWHGAAPDLPLTGPSGHPPFLNILARIRGVSPAGAVTLEFIEQP